MSIGASSKVTWYQVDQAWDKSRAQISQQFLNTSSMLTSALSDAMSNQISGMATLAAQAALTRIQGKTAAATGASGSSASSPTAATSSASTLQHLTGSTGSSASSTQAASQYAITSAASILSSNSNVLNLFS